jgi:hypothetical protein
MGGTDLFLCMAVSPGDPGPERRTQTIKDRHNAALQFGRFAHEAIEHGAERIHFFHVGAEGFHQWQAGHGDNAIPLKEAVDRLQNGAVDSRPDLPSRADEAIQLIAKEAGGHPERNIVAVVALDGIHTNEQELIAALHEASKQHEDGRFGVVLVQVGDNPEAVAIIRAVKSDPKLRDVRVLAAEDFSHLSAPQVAWMGLGGGGAHQGRPGNA